MQYTQVVEFRGTLHIAEFRGALRRLQASGVNYRLQRSVVHYAQIVEFRGALHAELRGILQILGVQYTQVVEFRGVHRLQGSGVHYAQIVVFRGAIRIDCRVQGCTMHRLQSTLDTAVKESSALFHSLASASPIQISLLPCLSSHILLSLHYPHLPPQKLHHLPHVLVLPL